MTYEVQKVALGIEFKVCPKCGYKDGFHTMLKKEGETTKWLLICPSCHQVFDVGLTV